MLGAILDFYYEYLSFAGKFSFCVEMQSFHLDQDYANQMQSMVVNGVYFGYVIINVLICTHGTCFFQRTYKKCRV